MASSHSRLKLSLTLQEIIRFAVHACSKSDTVSLYGCIPCHAEDARCEKTSRRIPSRRIFNCWVMSESSNDIQSTRAFVTKIGHHFGINVPFLVLVPHLPQRRSIFNLQWIEHSWISVDRMLLQPLLIRLLVAGNQTYRVFIRLIDPNHSLNLARAPPCFSG